MSTAELKRQLESLSVQDLALLEWELRWRQTARPEQIMPAESLLLTQNISNILLMAGRGFGKTRVGAEWVGLGAAKDAKSFSGVIAPTFDDLRKVCFEGPAGLLNVIPEVLVSDYNKSFHFITLTNGSIIQGYSAQEPKRLRGPQHSRMWADEVAAWDNAMDTYDMAKMGLRLGSHPIFLATTTPRPMPLVKMLVNDKRTRVIRGKTYDNRDNLAPSFFEELKKYEGTRLGRQELEGELIDLEEAGIVKRSEFRIWPSQVLPRFQYIVMSLDTAFTEKTMDKKKHEADYSACQVWGVFELDEEEEELERWEGDKRIRRHIMLLHAWKDRLGLPELARKVAKESKFLYGKGSIEDLKPMYGPALIVSGQGKPIDVIVIEEKGSGISLRQTLASENILTYPYNPGNADKLQRLHAVTPVFASGRVWVPESEQRPGQPKSWADSVISTVCSYHGEGTVDFDDEVDACSQALRYLYENILLSVMEQKAPVAMEQSTYVPPAARNPYLN